MTRIEAIKLKLAVAKQELKLIDKAYNAAQKRYDKAVKAVWLLEKRIKDLSKSI